MDTDEHEKWIIERIKEIQEKCRLEAEPFINRLCAIRAMQTQVMYLQSFDETTGKIDMEFISNFFKEDHEKDKAP